ncbi:putative ferric-chelate reductase 1 homolog isoform X2 [Pomacea canaliculata]|nr:putative ferric-chelate reductase 1 homolog isoform X2 [Pomacea canaliculata]XP_025095481.1 putative ferric-chelate reductase 1 homolog isoform X2 [Pomacea canaliculata]
MFPKHGAVEKQLLPSPFFISLSSNTYTPGQVITVELTSTNGTLFRGLQVKATRSQGNSERAVGSFMVSHDNKTKAFTCDGSYKSMATHANAADVKRVVLKWTAPRENIGDIVFLATIVEKFDTIWYGIKSTLRTASPSNLVEQSKLPELNSSMDDVDFSSCGSEKSCFLYPRYCKSSDCLAAASFRHVDDMFLQFELMAKNVSYISIGFSEDVKMGGDETISCTADGGVLSVQHGANPKQFNDRMVRDQLSNLRIKQADGIIMCSFTRPVMAVTRTVNQSAPDLQFVEKVFDLSKEYHVMLAWGTVKLGTDVINKHVDLPVVTDRKVNFQGKDIYRGSSLPLEVRAHAGLMALAWIVLAGITTAMSRYYKDWFGERLLLGTKVWFQLHRAAAISTVLFASIGLIIIFVYLNGLVTKELNHVAVGLTVTSLMVIQIIGGLARPDPKSSCRPVFNWLHRISGFSAHILSAAAMYLAFNIRFVSRVMRDFGVAILTGWVAVQIVWTIVFELKRCCPPKTTDKNRVLSVKEVLKSVDTILLVAYCLSLLVVWAATISSFIVY